VRINNTLIYSDGVTIITSVPRGTVLSPILFTIIYVTSLGHLNTLGKLFSHADNTAIIISTDKLDNKCMVF